MQSKPWSRKYSDCTVCHTADRPHVGSGLCRLCWYRKYNVEHSAELRKYKHGWYLDNGGAAKSKLQREQRYFSGQRESILKRDGYKCTTCGRTNQLVVHHKDGAGRGNKAPNNNPKNLKTLCRGCHIDAHRVLLQTKRGFTAPAGSRWSAKYGLDACKECGRKKTRHASKGLCIRCYSRHHYSK